MVMLEPSREDWALLVSIAVFKKLRISLIIRIICEICEICVRKRRLRIIRNSLILDCLPPDLAKFQISKKIL
jgi:hypothetical protein